MSSTYLTPIPPELHEVFGEPKPGTAVYEQEGDFEDAQAWFRVLRRAVGDVIALPSVSLFVPVSRNAIHKRIKEGKLSCFKFQIKETDPDVSQSLNRERPHAFVPITECLLWYQEFHDRLVIRDGMLPADVPAERLYSMRMLHRFDVVANQHCIDTSEALNAYQSAYLERTREKAWASLPEDKKKLYERGEKENG